MADPRADAASSDARHWPEYVANCTKFVGLPDPEPGDGQVPEEADDPRQVPTPEVAGSTPVVRFRPVEPHMALSSVFAQAGATPVLR
jgi:hypothetical protein